MKNKPGDRRTEHHNSTQLESSSSNRDNYLNPRPEWWPEEWPWPPEFERSTSTVGKEVPLVADHPNSSVNPEHNV
jgi:hypothetical protein